MKNVERTDPIPEPRNLDSSMNGMILCGGKGKRLRPLTKGFPKSLLEFKEDYCALFKQLLEFKYLGIKDVILIIGHYGREIRRVCGREFRGVKIDYLDSKTGTLDAIREGLAIIEGADVMIRNGDIVTDANLKRMVETSKEPITLFVTPLESPFGIIELGDTKILSFREKPVLEHYINGGVYLVKNDSFDLFEGYPSGDVERIVYPVLAREGKLGYYKENQIFWKSLDTAKDLEAIKEEYFNRVDKPWGYEKTLISTDKYLEKLLYIKGGYQTSYHYHTKKDETLRIEKGRGAVYFKDGRRENYSKGDSIRLKPLISHTIVAVENTLVSEISTPHPEDTVRVKDYYQR
ncbi:MAG: sugar phosphate nucleotidyltransferase [Candidatus Hydrothermarchaeales archaeon]